MKKIIIFVSFILILSFIVLIHESGHLFAALYLGYPVESFNIGMGKTLLEYNFQGILYNINILPLGGFVRLQAGFDYMNVNQFGYFIFLFSGLFLNITISLIVLRFNFKDFGQLVYRIITLKQPNLYEKYGYVVLVAYLSMYLFILNSLPLYPFDGGKIFLLFITNIFPNINMENYKSITTVLALILVVYLMLPIKFKEMLMSPFKKLIYFLKNINK